MCPRGWSPESPGLQREHQAKSLGDTAGAEWPEDQRGRNHISGVHLWILSIDLGEGAWAVFLAVPGHGVGSPGPAPSSFPTQPPRPILEYKSQPRRRRKPRPGPLPSPGLARFLWQQEGGPGARGAGPRHTPFTSLPPNPDGPGVRKGHPAPTCLLPTSAECDPGESKDRLS